MCYSLYSPCKTPSPKSITPRGGAWKEREEKEERSACGHSFRNDIKWTSLCVCAKYFFFFQFRFDNGRRSFSQLITLIAHSTKTRKYILSKGKVGVCVLFVYCHNWDVNPNSRLRPQHSNKSISTILMPSLPKKQNETNTQRQFLARCKSQANIDQL